MKKSNQFCQDILDLEIARPGSLVNLVMSLSSYQGASHPVELSESVLFDRKYHSVYRSIQDLAKDSETYQKVSKSIRALCIKYKGFESNIYDFQTDTTPVCKPHSTCLEGRTYIDVPNQVIAENKPLSIGYKYSYINMGLNQPCYDKIEDAFSKSANIKWTAPLSIERVKVEESPREVAIAQLFSIFEDEDLPFKQADLVCNTLDSHYGNSAYLSSVYPLDNLVSIVRLRGGMKIYPKDYNDSTGGAPQIYGDCHYLIEQSGIHHYKHKGEAREKYRKSVLDLPCREKFSFLTQTQKGKLLRVHIRRFNGMMFRSKGAYNMKDKPFNLLYVSTFDEEKRKRVFKPMWLAISGQKRGQVSSLQAYGKYSHRYDIEPFFRFSKQKLLLDKYQTSKVEYLDNWMLITQLASWLLWTASDQAKKTPKDWQKYLPEYKLVQDEQVNNGEDANTDEQTTKQQVDKDRLTIAQTRKGAETLFLSFDRKAFAVQKSNKGKGRKKGEKLEPKKRHKVVKKGKNLAQNRSG